MCRKIILSLLLLFLVTSLAFAAKPEGKLYIYPQNLDDAVYVDGLLVGQGNIYIEALEEGDYFVEVDDQAGLKVYGQKAKVKGNQTTIIKVGGQPLPTKGAVEYTPTFTLYIGYHRLSVTSGQIQSSGLAPNIVGLEINKNITDSLELSLGYASFFGNTSSTSGTGSIAVGALQVNLRRVWESDNWFKVNYIGGGYNSTNWTSSGNGYQFFYGGYSEPWGYIGALQTELGWTYFSGPGAVVANGIYLKTGWAF